MAREDNFGLEFQSAGGCRVEIVQFKPEQDAVAVGLEILVSNWAVMVLDIPAMQLHHEAILPDKALILGASVGTLTAQQVLIPAAAAFDVADANQWLGTHERHLC